MSSTLRLFWEAAGGNVPEHWEFKTIDELLEHPKAISVGVMYPGSDSDGGVPLIKVSDVKSGAIASRPSFCISNKVDEEYKRTRLNGSELLLTLVGNPGDCVIVTDEMCGWNVARALAVIRLKDTQLRSWIRYVLASKPAQHLIEARLNTTVQKTLNLKDVREIGIPIPPREERDSITKVIDSIEKKTLLNTQINQTLESIAQVIFKSWFIDFEPVRAKIAAKQEGKDPELAAMCAISGKSEAEIEQMAEENLAELRATTALFPDELVESELGEVPKGWEVTRFNKIILQYIDNRGKTPPTQIDGIPLLEVKHLPEGSLNPDLNTEKRVSLETFNNWFRAHLQEDDLIISTVGTIGRLCIIPADKKLTIAQNILGLRFKKDEVNPLFMYYQMDSCKFRNDVNARLVITVQASIKRKDLETIDLLKPDINIQNVFAEKIKPFVLSQQSDESLKLIDIRDTLLPKLLLGEVSVEDIKQQQDLA